MASRIKSGKCFVEGHKNESSPAQCSGPQVNSRVEERACVSRKDPSPETARESGRAGPEEEDRSVRKAGAEEGGGDPRGETSVDGDIKEHRQPDPGQAQKSRAQKSRRAAEKSGDSGEASHVPEGTWLHQVCDRLRGQFTRLEGKVGSMRGRTKGGRKPVNNPGH
ncbi:hypothetical protein NDU88_003241 [Pleurodeles waltl]|uniref:Uncharacterized protein n=1 Tax=Pleurodeles waltl TaxID=8319 RepID=A0AAV7W516_PLEWA|nr:hypothetical protein NDU88_003241 [Pleurodeles waltl]